MAPTVYVVEGGVLRPLWVVGAGGGEDPGPPANVAPSAVGSLSSTVTASAVTLTWTAATDTDGAVDSYRVTRDGGSPVIIDAGTLTYTATGLAAQTAYTFAVWAVDDQGAAGPHTTTVATTSAVPAETVAHGSEITATNTGHTAFYDTGLGRYVTDGDLTVHNSTVSLSDFVANGGTITRRWFKGGLIIDRTGVTIRACKFDQGVSGYYAGQHRPFTLEWCTIDTPGSAGDDGIHFQDYIAYRCRIGGNSDGAKTNGNVSLTECFIRVEGQDSADHNDGTQNVGGSGPVTIERCNIDCRPTNGIGAPNAALFCADGAAGLQTWHDNWCAGGGYVLRLYENATYDVQGNKVLDGSWVYGPAARAVISSDAVTWGTERPNVLVDASGSTLSTLTKP